jgi:hypothetical protein
MKFWEDYIKLDELKRPKKTKELLEHSLKKILPKDKYKKQHLISVIDSYFQDLANEVEEESKRIKKRSKRTRT